MGASVVPGVMQRELAQLARPWAADLAASYPDAMVADVPVSDHGIDGAIPLEPGETWWPAAPVSDADWTTQNRRINNLLEGR